MHKYRLIAPPFRYALYTSAGIFACSAPDAPFEDTGAVLTESPNPDTGDAGDNGTAGDPRSEPPGSEPSEITTRRVRLRFRATVGSEQFACGSRYVASSGVTFTPVDLRLFVQDLALLTAAGREQPITLDARAPWQLESVALLDFEDASGACLAGTRELNLEVTGRVPSGEYRGFAFTNGVPEVYNHADPARLPAPLQAGSMSWGWLSGYRFLMAEVAAVSASADAGTAGSALVHVGSTACSGSPSGSGVACNKPNRNRVRLADFDPDASVVVVDVGDLFNGTDLSEVTTCHSSGDACAPLFDRLGLSLDDGSATDQQAIYRVEPAPPAVP